MLRVPGAAWAGGDARAEGTRLRVLLAPGPVLARLAEASAPSTAPAAREALDEAETGPDAGGRLDPLAELYAPPRRDWVRVNLVTTLDGAIAGADGTSESLTSPLDRRILRVIRDAADAVVVGASTVRQEPRLLTPGMRLVVVTATGDLSGHSLPAARLDDVTVVHPPAARAAVERTLPGARRLELAPSADSGDGADAASTADAAAAPGLDLRAVVDALAERGLRSLVLEGGAATIAAALSADVVDELCLNTSPALSAGAANAPRLTAGAADPATPRFDLTHALLDDTGFLFTRRARPCR